MIIQSSYSNEDFIAFLNTMEPTQELYGKTGSKKKTENGVIVTKTRKYKSRVDTLQYYMCKECFSLFKGHVTMSSKIKISCDKYKLYPFTSETVRVDCPVCKRIVSTIILDYNIAKAIQIFNFKGYFTEYCCEGHGKKYSEPYIVFEFRDDLYDLLHTLPDSWFIDYSQMKWNLARNKENLVIRADPYNYKEALYEILVWAKEIPYATWMNSASFLL